MRNGSLLKTKYYNFYFTKSCDTAAERAYICEHNRLAVVIRKKVGVAVIRNREKRIVRQLFRCTNIESHIDLVVYIKQSDGDFAEKKAIFDQTMTEIDKMYADGHIAM